MPLCSEKQKALLDALMVDDSDTFPVPFQFHMWLAKVQEGGAI